MKEIMRVRPGWSGAGRRCEVLCSPVYVGYIGKPAQGQHWTVVHFYDEEDPTCVKSACLEPFTAPEHKRCPFCGSIAECRPTFHLTNSPDDSGYTVFCTNEAAECNVRLQGDTEADAWAAWDKRKEDE